MADMTTKHHKLIADAIAAGVHGVLKASELNDPNQPSLGEGVIVVRSSTLMRVMTNELIDSFRTVLAYTHDKFDPADFGAMVRTAVGK